MTTPSHEPAGSGDSDDAVWEDLVRRLEAAPASPAHTDETENPGSGDPTPGPAVDPALFTFHPALHGPRDHELQQDPDDGAFVPEEPPALGSGNPLLNLAWVVAAGAPIALLLLAIFWRGAPAPLWIGLVAVAVAAVVFLFTRLPRHRHDGDDGARV